MAQTLNLANPPAKYRPVPFWSWNEKLDPEVLREQVRQMHEAGLGGFFMHARGGLQTAYLSEEWMECVNACLDEAGKLGMDAWLYDENGWPSGFGGGLVNGLGVKYQQKYLRHEIIDAAEACKDDTTIAFYTTDGALIGRTLPEGSTGPVLRCYYEINPFYVDNLDAEVVAEFIRVTHEFYYRTIPEELLKHLKGIFSDEPQLSRKGLLWSFTLEEAYWQAYHRELLPELPMLFLGMEGSDGMRIRFWKLAARLFSVNFMKQIHDWCEEHGWMLTGHHVLEESCQSQLSSNGAIMPQYQYYHIPGMDHLCRTEPSPVAMTQLMSAAMQAGRKQVLTESFALSGWNFNFSGMKWMYQQQLAHGLNLLCPHLQGYSLRGLRKRDYPASLFVHQPWWGDYAKLNGYFGRAGMLLAEGEASTPVLVIHPLSSAWKHYTGDDHEPKLDFYTQTLLNTTRALDALQIPHHYADEQLAEDYGCVENGEIRIGEVAYELVIVPQLTNFSKKTAELLRQFAAAGGTVLTVRNRLEPDTLTIDGEAAPQEFRDWFAQLPACDSEAAAAEIAAEQLPGRVMITEHGVPARRLVGTYRDFRELDGRSGRFHFIANLQYNQPCNVTIALPRTGRQVEVIDPVTGEFSLLSGVRRSGNHLVFDYPFAAGDAAMFFVAGHPAKHAPKLHVKDAFALPPVKRLDNGFTIREDSGNLLTLDRCRYRVDGGEWIADDVSVIHGRLLNLKHDCDLELEFSFELAPDFDFNAPLTLVAETPERYRFNFNGHDFDAEDGGPLFDRAFRRIALPAALRPGRNVLTMKTRYHQPEEVYAKLERAKQFETEYNMLTFDSEVESVYLYGDFSVRHSGRTEELIRDAERFHGNFELGAPLAGSRADASDLVRAGMPFFAGKVTLYKEFELTADEAEAIRYLRFAPHGANSFAVKINGENAGTCFWGPYALRADEFLRAGVNKLEIELTTSLRNLLGPHHLEEGESYGVHTLSFNREANAVGWPAPAYNPGYCFVKLGLAELVLA